MDPLQVVVPLVALWIGVEAPATEQTSPVDPVQLEWCKSRENNKCALLGGTILETKVEQGCSKTWTGPCCVYVCRMTQNHTFYEPLLEYTQLPASRVERVSEAELHFDKLRPEICSTLAKADPPVPKKECLEHKILLDPEAEFANSDVMGSNAIRLPLPRRGTSKQRWKLVATAIIYHEFREIAWTREINQMGSGSPHARAIEDELNNARTVFGLRDDREYVYDLCRRAADRRIATKDLERLDRMLKAWLEEISF